MEANVKTRIFIGGLPEEEWERQQKLSKRPLTPADIPSESWRDGYNRYWLREDGIIEAEGLSVPLGFVTESGAVSWTKC